jgi:hypothetical protein
MISSVAQAHDRALAELLLDVGERGVEGLLAVSTSHVVRPSIVMPEHGL